jgi:dienelactone hydrolase
MLGSLLVGAALSAAGCWPYAPQLVVPEGPVPPTEKPAPVMRGPVTAEQVHSGNAREAAQALAEELDREQGMPEGRPVR